MAKGSEKKIFWWKRDVKEAIRAKQDTFIALMQIRFSSDLYAPFPKRKKAAAEVFKVSKEHS